MPILTALQPLLHLDRPGTARPAPDHGGASAPALAVTVAVLVLAVGIVVTGAHEIILDAIRGALGAITG